MGKKPPPLSDSVGGGSMSPLYFCDVVTEKRDYFCYNKHIINIRKEAYQNE